VCSSIAVGIVYCLVCIYSLLLWKHVWAVKGGILSLQPMKVWVTKRREWGFSELYQVQNLYSTELAAGLPLRFSGSLCSYLLRACITRTLIFAALGDFGWVRTRPYFLTTVGISKLWDFGLLPRSHVQVTSQPVFGLHAKAALLRVHRLIPVSCWRGFC